MHLPRLLFRPVQPSNMSSIPSVEQVKAQIPSAEQVRAQIPSAADIQASLPSVAGVTSSIPSASAVGGSIAAGVKSCVPGHLSLARSLDHLIRQRSRTIADSMHLSR